jgi:3-deoxy-D-manno-octulosonic acid kinase
LLDFDRGRLRRPGSWRQANLARLYRSLKKIAATRPEVGFRPDDWTALMQGYG